MVWGVDNIIKTIYNGLNFFEPFINYYQGGGMFKRFSILWIMVASLAFSGLACGDLTQNGYQSSNSQEKSKQKKRQDEHQSRTPKSAYPSTPETNLAKNTRGAPACPTIPTGKKPTTPATPSLSYQLFFATTSRPTSRSKNPNTTVIPKTVWKSTRV